MHLGKRRPRRLVLGPAPAGQAHILVRCVDREDWPNLPQAHSFHERAGACCVGHGPPGGVLQQLVVWQGPRQELVHEDAERKDVRGGGGLERVRVARLPTRGAVAQQQGTVIRAWGVGRAGVQVLSGAAETASTGRGLPTFVSARAGSDLLMANKAQHTTVLALPPRRGR